MDLDRSTPWAFSDGAAQNNACGGGALLFFTDSHFFVLSMGLRGGHQQLLRANEPQAPADLFPRKRVQQPEFYGRLTECNQLDQSNTRMQAVEISTHSICYQTSSSAF